MTAENPQRRDTEDEQNTTELLKEQVRHLREDLTYLVGEPGINTDEWADGDLDDDEAEILREWAAYHHIGEQVTWDGLTDYICKWSKNEWGEARMMAKSILESGHFKELQDGTYLYRGGANRHDYQLAVRRWENDEVEDRLDAIESRLDALERKFTTESPKVTKQDYAKALSLELAYRAGQPDYDEPRGDGITTNNVMDAAEDDGVRVYRQSVLRAWDQLADEWDSVEIDTSGRSKRLRIDVTDPSIVQARESAKPEEMAAALGGDGE